MARGESTEDFQNTFCYDQQVIVVLCAKRAEVSNDSRLMDGHLKVWPSPETWRSTPHASSLSRSNTAHNRPTMLRLSLRFARRSTRLVEGAARQQPARSFGISRHVHERWNEEEPSDEIPEETDHFDPTDMDLYHYDPQAAFGKLSTEEEEKQEEKRVQKVRDELDMRTGRLWSDPWEITDEDWSSTKEWDDYPDWKPSFASKLSVDRIKIFEGGVPSLSEISELPLPRGPPPHPGSGKTRAYASQRKAHQYKYILSQVSIMAEPRIEEIQKLETWEEKQDAIDELFESVEFELKAKEEVLGLHPTFGLWVETAMEEYLKSLNPEDTDDAEEEGEPVEEVKDAEDKEALPIFMDLYDKSDIPEGDEVAPTVPRIVHPLMPHPKGGEGRMVEEWELAAHDETRRIMLRQCTRQIARIIEQNEAFRVYVDGKRGVGKTATLVSIVAAARKSGNIVLFMPDGDRLRKLGFYIEPNTKIEGLFDLPLLSQEICSNFLDSHAKDLEGMKAPEETRNKFLPDDLLKRMPEEYEDDLSLLGLLKLAKEETVFAPMCYSIVVETLMNQDEKPFVVALDEFNCYYDHGQYFHMDYDESVREAIPLDQINLFKPFMDCLGITRNPDEKLEPVPIKRGGIIVCTSENRAVAREFTDGLTASAEKAAADVNDKFPMHIVTVPRYTPLEVEHILSNFDVTGIGRLRFDRGDTVMDEQEVNYLRMVSGSKGQLLLDACIL